MHVYVYACCMLTSRLLEYRFSCDGNYFHLLCSPLYSNRFDGGGISFNPQTQTRCGHMFRLYRKDLEIFEYFFDLQKHDVY